jgi:NADH:ubiquinone oxidoreductase subunit
VQALGVPYAMHLWRHHTNDLYPTEEFYVVKAFRQRWRGNHVDDFGLVCPNSFSVNNGTLFHNMFALPSL